MIEMKNLRMSYDGKVNVLDGVHLHLEKGSFTFLQGASGSGKSTLLKILYRDVDRYEGEVKIDGKSIREMPKYLTRRCVATIFQTFELLPRKTILENVCVPGEVLGKDERVVIKDAKELLEIVGLAQKEGMFPNQLSWGEQQRVAIARALLNRPKVLLADEPTGNLDPENAKNIIQLLKKVNEKQQTTMLIVTHSQDLLDTVEGRSFYMKNGKINEVLSQHYLDKKMLIQGDV